MISPPPVSHYDGRIFVPVIVVPWQSVRSPELRRQIAELERRHGKNNITVGLHQGHEVIYVAKE